MSELDRSPEQEQQWHRWRREGITATDVADAANGTYGGAYGVVARKLGRIEPEPENERMTRGHRWQPVIADAVHVLTGLFVVGEEAWCQSTENGTWRATVDGFLAESPEVSIEDVIGVLEVKTRGVGTRPNRDRWSDQVQWQLLVTQLDRAVIAEATIDDESDEAVGLHLTRVEADPDRQALLIDVAERLWSYVSSDTLPDPDSPDALPIVKAVNAEADPDADTVDLSDLAAEVARFNAIKDAERSVKAERELIEARIRDAVGYSTRGACEGFTVSVSKPRMVVPDDVAAEFLSGHPDLGRVVLDIDAVKAAGLYDDLRRPIGARTLTVKPTKGDQ